MAERLFDDLSAEEIKKKKQITLYLLRIKKTERFLRMAKIVNTIRRFLVKPYVKAFIIEQ